MIRGHGLTLAIGLATLGPAALASPVAAQGVEDPEPAANDYSDPAAWLCRPGRADACAVDLTTTVVEADGRMWLEPWSTDPYAPIDCFYVYPTVSGDSTPTSDMVAGPGELGVVQAQFARFGSVCRLFAPLYRQFTLASLRSRLSGGSGRLDRDLGYGDVLAAWRHYLANDNGGRGVVLIGHSQGASVLTRLIAEEIDGRDIQGSIVSALLLGDNIRVPPGADVGGSFRSIPLCRAEGQTGCVVTYSAYRADLPPARASLFGRGLGRRRVAGCTNPAALEGGEAELSAYLGTATLPEGERWNRDGPEIQTSFVRVPGLIGGRCVSSDGFSYLEIEVLADPADPRTDVIGGDVMLRGRPSVAWGLHLIDVSVAMGDLISLVGRQGESFLEGSAGAAPTEPRPAR